MLTTCHLFAGGGGGLLADLILGHKPIVAVEWESYACQILRERAAEGWFPDLRVYEGDVRMFDPSEYAGRVDCIHAGFPCQDLSVAGKQAGLGEGTRSGLYREVLRIADVVRPRYLFLENVAAIVSMGRDGIGQVIADLSAMGYDARWLTLRASDVGAPHHRDRWWCLATRRDIQRDVAESDCSRHAHGQAQVKSAEGRLDALGDSSASCSDVAYTAAQAGLCSGARCGQEQNIRSEYNGREIESTLGGMADGLASPIRSSQRIQKEGVGEQIGWWEVEPDIGRVTTGCEHRAHQLKALGNGQVPLQAAVAWRLLGGE